MMIDEYIKTFLSEVVCQNSICACQIILWFFKVTKGLRFVSGVLRIRLFFPSVYVLLLNWLLNVKQKSGMDICWLHTAGMINSFKKKKENQKCLVEGSEREKDRNVLNLGHALKPWTWPIIHMDKTHACC